MGKAAAPPLDHVVGLRVVVPSAPVKILTIFQAKGSECPTPRTKSPYENSIDIDRGVKAGETLQNVEESVHFH